MGPHVSAGADTRLLLDALRRIVQALRESARDAERHAGITGAQLFVLHTLAEAPALALNEVAARTHTHQSSASTVVAQLVARGLVRRQRSAVDGRQIDLSLSPRGRHLARQAPDTAQMRLVAAVHRLPPSHRRMLATRLAELAGALDTVERIPPMFFEERAGRARQTRGRRG